MATAPPPGDVQNPAYRPTHRHRPLCCGFAVWRRPQAAVRPRYSRRLVVIIGRQRGVRAIIRPSPCGGTTVVVDIDARRPRDVYAEACARIASPMEADGFRFARSVPQISRPVGPNGAPGLREIVMFLSSHYNNPSWVVLRLFPHVTSPALKRWRLQHEPDGNDVVAGGGFGRHLPRDEWNVAEPAATDEVLEVVRTFVLPWFELFENHGLLVEELCRRDVIAMSPEETVEYLLCFEGPEVAARSVDAYLERHPENAPMFWAWIHRFRREGVRLRYALEDVRNLANIVVAEGLTLRSPEGRDSPDLVRDSPPQRSRVIAMPADIADDLRSYGEDNLAFRVMDLRGDQLERLFELAAEHSYTGMLFAKALSLAAVEVIEGHARDLRRERRKFA